MKRNILLMIILFILISILTAGTLVLANPIDVDNLKNYDFDVIDDNTNHTTSAPLSFLTFVVYFIFFVLIAGLAYLTTRWIGKQQKKIRAKSKYMELIDSLQLSGDNALHIVKSPDGVLLLGTGKEGIFLLCKLDDEGAELIIQAEKNQIEENFSAQLNNYLSNIKWGTDHNKFGESK